MDKDQEKLNSSDNTLQNGEPLVHNEEEQPAAVNPMPKRSRLSKANVRKSRKTFVLSVLGIIAILFLLFKFGLPLISDASFIFGKVTSSPEKTENTTKDEAFVPVPDLDPLPQATKTPSVKVTGTSLAGLVISVYLNGAATSEVVADSDGNFEKDLKLTEGGNIIKAKAKKGETESNFSESLTISYKTKGPELSIDSPADGTDIHGPNPVEIKGKTDPDANVLVNDFQAITNSSGNWSYMITLVGGGNDIKVISTDAAGNKTEKAIHVNYSQ